MKLQYDKVLSSFAFNFNLRRYTTGVVAGRRLAHRMRVAEVVVAAAAAAVTAAAAAASAAAAAVDLLGAGAEVDAGAVVRVSVGVDTRDECGRTPLMAAAASAWP